MLTSDDHCDSLAVIFSRDCPTKAAIKFKSTQSYSLYKYRKLKLVHVVPRTVVFKKINQESKCLWMTCQCNVLPVSQDQNGTSFFIPQGLQSSLVWLNSISIQEIYCSWLHYQVNQDVYQWHHFGTEYWCGLLDDVRSMKPLLLHAISVWNISETLLDDTIDWKKFKKKYINSLFVLKI